MGEKCFIVRGGFNLHGGPRHPLEMSPVLDHPFRQRAVSNGAQNGGRKLWEARGGVLTDGEKIGRIHGVLQGTPEDAGDRPGKTSQQAIKPCALSCRAPYGRLWGGQEGFLVIRY
jgi:hypothetical protein